MDNSNDYQAKGCLAVMVSNEDKDVSVYIGRRWEYGFTTGVSSRYGHLGVKLIPCRGIWMNLG